MLGFVEEKNRAPMVLLLIIRGHVRLDCMFSFSSSRVDWEWGFCWWCVCRLFMIRGVWLCITWFSVLFVMLAV